MVTAVLETIKEGLQRDGSVETPLGEFYTKSRTESYDRERQGHKQSMHQQPTRVVFKPDPNWLKEGGGEQ